MLTSILDGFGCILDFLLLCAQLIKKYFHKDSKHTPAPSTPDLDSGFTKPSPLSVHEVPITVSDSNSESSHPSYEEPVLQQVSFDLVLQGVLDTLMHFIVPRN